MKTDLKKTNIKGVGFLLCSLAFQSHAGLIGGSTVDWSIAGVGDVDGDGTDDVVWRHKTSGEVIYYKVINGVTVGSGKIGDSTLDWSIGGVGDVDGDGTDDIVWRHNTSGEVIYYKVVNGTSVGGGKIGDSTLDWSVGGVGDVDGDGTDDIVWRHNTSGEVTYYKVKNGLAAGGGKIGGSSLDWSVADVSDVDGDGTDDIVWKQNDTNKALYYKVVNGLYISHHNLPDFNGSDITDNRIGDINGDGINDIVWRREDGEVHWQPVTDFSVPKAFELKLVDAVKVWSDQGSGANRDVTILRTDVTQGYYSLGDVAVDSYTDTIPAFAIKPLSGYEKALAEPVDYVKLWDDSGSGADQDVSLWRPVPPAGYQCLGDVATNGWKPSTQRIRCVEEQYLSTLNSTKIWDDRGSDADRDVTLFSIMPGQSPIFTVAQHTDNNPAVFWLNNQYVNSQMADFLAAKDSPQELNRLLAAYNPVWMFNGSQDSQIFPVDIDESFRKANHLQQLECDNGNWRLNYNPGIARHYWANTQNSNKISTYAFAQFVDGGIDLHYYLYYPYNIANPVINDHDHEGDWEGAVISLRPAVATTKELYLKPVSLTTNAHGNDWVVAWESGDVWLASHAEYTNATGQSVVRHFNEIGQEILPPRLFVAKDSNGVYPNTAHERGVFDHPDKGSTNRTCVDAHLSIYCDYIETAEISHRLRFSTYPIRVAKNIADEIQFLSIKNNLQPISWLSRNTSCQTGQVHQDMTNIPNGIRRWGDASNAGGPTGVQFREAFNKTIK